MKVEVLGSGGAFSKYPTAFLLNDTILIDCGYPLVNELIADKRISQITDVFVTHTHSDHISGLENIVYFKRFKEEKFNLWGAQEIFDYYNSIPCSYNNTDFNAVVFQPVFKANTWKNRPEFMKVTDDVYVMPVKLNHVNNVIFNTAFIFCEQDGYTLRFCIFTGDFDPDSAQTLFHSFLGYFGDEGSGVRQFIIERMSDEIHKNNEKLPIDKPYNDSALKKLSKKTSVTMFCDMGFTGVPKDSKGNRVHPSEEDIEQVWKIVKSRGDIQMDIKIYGVHVDKALTLFEKAERHNVFAL